MKQNFTKSILIALTLIFAFSSIQAQNAFWSEDFANGLPADWTNVDNSNQGGIFDWCDNPAAGVPPCPGLWSDAINLQSEFAAATASNGFMSCNSDAVGATIASPHETLLTTGSIDCTAQGEVWFVCQTHIGTFDLDAETNAIIQVSNDGGVNWTDFTLFPGLVTGATMVGTQRWSFNPHILPIDISAVAGNQANVQVRFSWVAGFEYIWSVDDVALYDADPTSNFLPGNEITAVRSAAGNNAGTPYHQVYPISFLLDVQNNGLNMATGVTAKAEIIDLTTNASVFSETINISDITPLDQTGDTDVAFDNIWPGRFTPPAAVNAYQGLYTVSSDSLDENLSNDTLDFSFVITDSTFRKDLREPDPAGNLGGILPADPDWTYAAGYYTPNGNDYEVSSVTIAVSNTDDPLYLGANLHIVLYKWEDVNGDGSAQAEERGFGNPILGGEILGDFTYSIDGTEINENLDITVVLDNFLSAGDPIMLEDGGQYIVAVEMFNPAGATEAIAIVADNDISYLNSWFVNDSLATFDPVTYIPQHNAFFSNETGFDIALDSDFGWSPHIHMNVNEVETISTNDQLDDANIIDIYPNPANEIVTLDMNLVNTFDKVNVLITDLSGKSMMEANYENVLNEKFQYNISNFAAGTYYLQVRTEEGNKTKRFVVVK